MATENITTDPSCVHTVASRRKFLAMAGAWASGPFLVGKIESKAQAATSVLHYRIDSIAQLKQLDDTADLKGLYHVLGYCGPQSGGGGVFVWDAHDTTSPDNGGTIFISDHPILKNRGRWKRTGSQQRRAGRMRTI